MAPWVRKIFIVVMPRILFMQRPHYIPRYSAEPPEKTMSLYDGNTLE